MGRIKILLISLAVLLSMQGYASHLLGGELTWKCDPNIPGNYIFTLKVYRDCSGSTLTTNQLVHGPTGTIPMNHISITDISPRCYDATQAFGCPSPAPNGSVEEWVWESNSVSLTGTPPPTGWEFYWTSFARPPIVVNISPAQTDYYVRAVMYPYVPPGRFNALPADSCYDNSPYFDTDPVSAFCEGYEFTYTQLAGDKEVDSLYYSWAQPLEDAGEPVNWVPGFSMTAPFPDQSESNLNGPVTLNNESGEITTRIYDAPGGITGYVSCIKVEAWKDCQLKAEVFRDFAAVVHNNCGNQNPTKPSLEIDTTVYNWLNREGNTYRVRVYPGNNINFNMQAFDPDFSGGYPQEIAFQAGGLQVNRPLGTPGTCEGVGPCATFTPVGQSGYINRQINKMNFDWTPGCQHLSYSECGSSVNTYRFAFRMKDDGCPVPKGDAATFLVEVVAGDPSPVILTCSSPISEDEVFLSWEKATPDSGLQFNYYMVLASKTLNGPVDTLTRIYNVDSINTILNNSNGYEHFYIIKSTGICDFLSEPSDTVRVIDMTLIATPPGNANSAKLNWSPFSNDALYEIWSEIPKGSGNWEKVGETTNLTYTDEVTICGDTLSYQVRVTDTATGCQSTSNIKSAYFSDQINKDQMVIDSATVSEDGNAMISWDPSAYGDVVEYFLLLNDPQLGWITVDTIPRGEPMPYEWDQSMADSRSEEFRVMSIDSCGNLSDDQVVRPHKTIFLRSYLNKCEGYARVSWNPYEGFPRKSIEGYRILVSINGEPWRLQGIAAPEDTAFVQRHLESGSEYCYRVQAFDTTGTLYSTSNQECIEAAVPQGSRILYLAQVTNNYERNSLDLNFLVDGSADVSTFDIERAPDRMGPYQVIGTVGKPASQPYLIDFSDYGVDGSTHHYYYRISATDSCGGRDTVSNIGRNILLNVTPRSNLTNLLTWNPYEEWDGVVAAYNIYRQAADELDFSYIGQVNGNDTTFVDDIADGAVDYTETSGNFCYYVEAVEGNNSLGIVNSSGLPYNSKSQTECVNQRARTFMATAFRPGSDIPENREFGPSLKFNEVENYYFYIMNRWGVKVYETDDPEQKWDGTHNGNDAAQGTYIYFLRYSTPGDYPVEERGSFTLIR